MQLDETNKDWTREREWVHKHNGGTGCCDPAEPKTSRSKIPRGRIARPTFGRAERGPKPSRARTMGAAKLLGNALTPLPGRCPCISRQKVPRVCERHRDTFSNTSERVGKDRTTEGVQIWLSRSNIERNEKRCARLTAEPDG